MTPGQIVLLEALGAPYWWGKGALRDGLAHWPQGPWDCSGYAQAALLVLEIVRPDAWGDVRAHDLAMACDPVAAVDVVLGDLVFYGLPGHISHVMVALDARMCIGATGGTSRTLGDDPRACVAAVPIAYRRDLRVIGRLKAQYRRSA